jgi:dethiobiotin synthetase
MPGILVTATDTEVGKTTVACALVRRLRGRGVRVGVLKPFESGCAEAPDGQLVPADAVKLKAAAGDAQPLETVCLHRFRLPLAPGIAARREGRQVTLAPTLAAFEVLARSHQVVVVEGAGGLLVPLTPGEDVADLAVALGLPLVVVARARLGTLNHTRLTVEAARARGLEIAAVVLNAGPDPVGPGDDPSITDNGEVLRRLTGLPILGPLPHLAGGDPDLSAHLDPLLDALAL